jgi:glycosidase
VRYRLAGWTSTQGNGRNGSQPEIWAQDGQGFWFNFSGEQALTTFAYSVEAAQPKMPIWARDAVIYQIFLDRFRSSNPNGEFSEPEGVGLGQYEFHGGTLQGVHNTLPYLAALGVNCLWLSPINSAETFHRYDATDFYQVDPRLGTNEDFKALTDAAHALGMKVVLDYVPSHVSWHHPAFLAAQEDKQALSYSWFSFDEWPTRYRNFLEVVPSLPSLNGLDEGARAHIINGAVQWVRDYGVDGFRLDHAVGQGMDFWIAFRVATREVQPEVFSFGEATDTPDSLKRYQGKLDGMLDFPLASAFRHTFGAGDWNVARFDHFISAYEAYLASGPGMVSFLDNHDMDRFLYVARNNTARLKLAALCQFTLAATPVIYYGTEVGMSQVMGKEDPGSGGDVQARQDMSWQPADWDQDVLGFYKKLIHLRNEHTVLRQGLRRTLHLDVAQGTYAYVRSAEGESESTDILVLFNLSNQQQTILLPTRYMSEHCLLTTDGKPELRPTASGIEIQLAPLSGAVFALSLSGFVL